MTRVRIGELLVKRGRLDPLQLESALGHQHRWGGRLGRSILKLGFMEERAFLETLGEQLGVPFVSLEGLTVAPEVLALVPERLLGSRKILPLAKLGESRRGPLLVALADPGDLTVLDEVAFATGLDVRPVLVTEGDLDRARRRLLGGEGSAPVAAAGSGEVGERKAEGRTKVEARLESKTRS